MEKKVTYLDRLKELVDKDVALNNAIIDSNYSKFKSVIEKTPETLNLRHEKLRHEVVTKNVNLNLQEKAEQFCIQQEIKYQSEKNNAKFYVNENHLQTSNPTETLKEYLNNDRPSFKEPIIHYINQGADLSLLTKESLNKTLQDISFKNYGMAKIAESDKLAIIDYAKCYAIKTNNLEAYKHLDKEFGISETIAEGKKQGEYDLQFISKNDSTSISNYLNTLYSLENEKSKDNSLKMTQSDLNKSLDQAISQGKYDQIKPLIIAGADDKIITADKLSRIDGNKLLEVITNIKDALEERSHKENINHTKQNLLNNSLIEAVQNKNALNAFSAVKNGADTSILEDKHYVNFSSELEKKKFNEGLIDALNSNKKQENQSINISNNM